MPTWACCAGAFAVALLSVACAKDTQTTIELEAGAETMGDGAVQVTPTAPCLDRPTDLPRPPSHSGQLPCDLLPPGFGNEKASAPAK